MSRLLSLLLLCSAIAAVSARRSPKATAYPNLYDAIKDLGLTDLKEAIDAADLKDYFSDGSKKVTLFAPNAAGWAWFFKECKKPKKPVDIAFACNTQQLHSNKARLAKFLKYHVLSSVVPAEYSKAKKTKQNWSKGPIFTKIDTVLGKGIFIRCRYTEKTKTFEAHGTGRDGFILKGAGMSNIKAGAGLLHVVDNVITRDPAEL